jgi:flavin-dependent dehydrogenase
VQRGNLALIGDASGSVDAVTGEGLRLSFEQSLALADSMARGDLRLYEVAHRRLISRPLLMAGLMLSMDRSSFLRRRTLYAMSREPQLFSNMLASHIGELSIPAFARRGMIPLTRAIFTA